MKLKKNSNEKYPYAYNFISISQRKFTEKYK